MNRGSRNFNTIRASGTRVRDREHGKQKGMERGLNLVWTFFFALLFSYCTAIMREHFASGDLVSLVCYGGTDSHGCL